MTPVSDPNLAALEKTGLLDGLPDASMDRLTRLAARLLSAPIAIVSIVTDTEQRCVSHSGLDAEHSAAGGAPLSDSICRIVAESGAPLVLTDTFDELLVQKMPSVRNGTVRAYAGLPLTLSSGHTLGTFCVVDNVTRCWTALELEGLNDLSALATAELEARIHSVERAASDRAAKHLHVGFAQHSSKPRSALYTWTSTAIGFE